MSRPADVYVIDIGRVVVRGAGGLAPVSPRAQIEAAVARAVATVELPAGRTARTEAAVTSGPLHGAAAVADAVGAAVATAVGKGPSRG